MAQDRVLTDSLLKAARGFSALVLTGPRRSGKTWLLRNSFAKAQYFLLEDPDVLSRVKADPQGFLDGLKLPVILDEIQNAPELLPFIRTRIDKAPSKKGQWLLTGSHEFTLMRGVSESMAGRAAIFQLLPFSNEESAKVDMLRGGYPEVVLRPSGADVWFQSYLQTYLERDVRAISAISDLGRFRRLLSLLATRHAQLLNRSDMAASIGVSVPTISSWIDILELSGLVSLVQPWYENYGKRLLKTPKLYWNDPGLVCYLLGIRTMQQLEASPFLGPVFEGWVASEIIKLQLNRGRRREIYYFRDQQGLELDFIIPLGGARLALLECKATRTPLPAMAQPIHKLLTAMGAKAGMHRGAVVCRARVKQTQADQQEVSAKGLGAGIKAIFVNELSVWLSDT